MGVSRGKGLTTMRKKLRGGTGCLAVGGQPFQRHFSYTVFIYRSDKRRISGLTFIENAAWYERRFTGTNKHEATWLHALVLQIFP